MAMMLHMKICTDISMAVKPDGAPMLMMPDREESGEEPVLNVSRRVSGLRKCIDRIRMAGM